MRCAGASKDGRIKGAGFWGGRHKTLRAPVCILSSFIRMSPGAAIILVGLGRHGNVH